MDVGPDKTLDGGKVEEFMQELKKLSVRFGIILEACECGGGIEPMLAPNHILEDEDWQYIRTPESIGGHYQYSPVDAYDDIEIPEGTKEDEVHIRISSTVDGKLN